MKRALLLTLVTLVSSIAHAADFPKLCGTAPMGQTSESGSFSIDQNKGHLTANVGPTGFALNVDVQLTKSEPVQLPRDPKDSTKVDPDYLNSMAGAGFTGLKDGISYQVVAIDSNGQPLKNVSVSSDPTANKIVNQIDVTVIPTDKGNMIIVAVPLDDSGIFPVFMATDNCQ